MNRNDEVRIRIKTGGSHLEEIISIIVFYLLIKNSPATNTLKNNTKRFGLNFLPCETNIFFEFDV